MKGQDTYPTRAGEALSSLERMELQRRRALDVWIGWLRLAVISFLTSAFALFKQLSAEGYGPWWLALDGAIVLYGAHWLFSMPAARPDRHRIVGAATLVGDGVLITAAPAITGLGPVVWAPLWPVVATYQAVRFGWRSGVAVGLLALVSFILQARWGFAQLPSALEGGAGQWASQLVTLLSLGAVTLVLGRLRDRDEELRDQLGVLAIRDGLTGLFNRRHFHETLDREVARAQREGGSLSLLMIDLDQFKSLNDAFGHPAGDRVLAQVAGVIASCIRIHDSAFRYGGEEFAVILPDAPPLVAERVAERIRHALANHRFGYRSVTASVGWSNFPHTARSEAELLSQADAALYRAKADGGNQVRGFQEEVPLPVSP